MYHEVVVSKVQWWQINRDGPWIYAGSNSNYLVHLKYTEPYMPQNRAAPAAAMMTSQPRHTPHMR